MKTIFHIDVNSAYLSWSAVDRLQHGDPLDLRTVPSIVGGNPETRHGIVLAKSLPAKKYKIQTGENLWEARNKCPDLIIVPPDYRLYMQCSSAFGDILREFSPLVEQYSIDEYFVDFSGMERLYPDPVAAAHLIKDRIKQDLGFTVNVGVSTNKLLAKMGSELKKPDMVHTLYPKEIQSKMWPLPISELFMVGRATERKLLSRNIKTIGDLAHSDPHWIKCYLKSHGTLIWNYAHGNDQSLVRQNRRPLIKGIGNSTTLRFDVTDHKTAHLALLSLIETVSARLRLAGYCAQLVSVSLRTSEFIGASHQRKLSTATDSTLQIHQIVCELFDELWQEQHPIRHLGVRVSELCNNDFIQLSFFDKDYEKQRKLDRVVDSIRSKYGSYSIVRSSFIQSGLSYMSGGTVVADEEFPMMMSSL